MTKYMSREDVFLAFPYEISLPPCTTMEIHVFFNDIRHMWYRLVTNADLYDVVSDFNMVTARNIYRFKYPKLAVEFKLRFG